MISVLAATVRGKFKHIRHVARKKRPYGLGKGTLLGVTEEGSCESSAKKDPRKASGRKLVQS